MWSKSPATEGRFVYNLCCKGGKVKIDPFKIPPQFLLDLLKFDGPPHARAFIEKIHQYNCRFALTSMGATIDQSLNNGAGKTFLKYLAPYVIGWDRFCLLKAMLQNFLNFIVFMVEMKLIIEFRL